MGIIVNVYRSVDGMDCTNDGVSGRFPFLCVVNADGPFDPDEKRFPAVMLEAGPCDSIRLVPAVEFAGEWTAKGGVRMFGGNYAATSDSRFGEAVVKLTGRPWYGAVAIHDRFEGRSHE